MYEFKSFIIFCIYLDCCSVLTFKIVFVWFVATFESSLSINKYRLVKVTEAEQKLKMLLRCRSINSNATS